MFKSTTELLRKAAAAYPWVMLPSGGEIATQQNVKTIEWLKDSQRMLPSAACLAPYLCPEWAVLLWFRLS